MTRAKTLDRRTIFRLTNARLGVIEILANFGVATRNQIARLHFNTLQPTESNRRQIRQLTDDLEAGGYVRYLPWFKRVYGLTGKGVAEARDRDMSDPYELSPEKSLETIGHELKRTDTHAAIERLCEEENWELRWRKTDLYRTVDPDDLFAITKDGRIHYFFFELENRRKTMEDLYAKVKRYFDYWDTEKCLREWGYFRKFNVLFQFPNGERMRNFIDFLAGKCNCTHYRGGIKHTCLPYGRKETPISASNFLFTHDKLMTTDPAGRILACPDGRTISFGEV